MMEIRIDPAPIRRISVDTPTCEAVSEIFKAIRNADLRLNVDEFNNVLNAIKEAYYADDHLSDIFCLEGKGDCVFQVFWNENL